MQIYLLAFQTAVSAVNSQIDGEERVQLSSFHWKLSGKTVLTQFSGCPPKLSGIPGYQLAQEIFWLLLTYCQLLLPSESRIPIQKL